MNAIVYHIASGHVFFTGIALVMLAAFASTRSNSRLQRITVLSFLIGAIFLSISSTAIPYWYYAVALIVTLAWLLSLFVKQWRGWSPYAVIVAWALAAAIEIPYHLTPSLQPTSARSLTVIGDSVTAGMGRGDESIRWPQLLAQEHQIDVQDISHMGETATSALKRLRKQPANSQVVILEIGGNDLLGTTTPAQFDHALDALLSEVSSPGRQVMMFELPLPPFQFEYGRIQRSLARKYQVSLVPKRVFLSILAANDATLDTIHLSQEGHERMAACVWQLVQSAYPE